ncbi:uncharacterized protein si:ch211-14c7.2 isoform X3 [Scophthalmus maximus]|uniref:uncharacterized protein si:ch211-14c7.2 isoform X3 n=1 Tax=Scophthalmus maximus TaxID=52904 RepID=UPI001FA8BF3F|nr:uncharacterized protein si:ch211-14c7.2 isoform X3 [Scophthalmus maximus]
MRPTTSIMLQQNNNNNYPCLNVSGSTRELLQRCSRASLPFPSRLELGLGDLPLIRGLRAWALCSKNRCKAVGPLGGGQAPTAPPAGHGSSTSCPRPANVYLSGEWGRMGYGLPLGLDGRQAGIGALVTVATLKTSEGSGKTQTQCLFLHTEKGSCLYSTAKPGAGVISSAASSGVGGWLRGKTGVGGRDAAVGRRDNGPNPPAQTGANRVRVRSGRRWRKSGNAAGREKTGMSKERQQRSREGPAGERQGEGDKGGPDHKQFPSMQQDGRRARQDKEKEAVCRSPRCCHNVSPKACTQCVRGAQTRESQEEGEEGGECPRRGVPNRLNGDVKGMRKERQKHEEEVGLCELESPTSVLAASNPDLESSCPGLKVSAILEDNDKEVQKNCASKDIRKLQESAEGSGGGRKKDEDTCSDTSIAPVEEIGGTSSNVFNVACADPSTSLALSPANPDPSPLPLGSMATGLPSLEEDEEEEGLRVAAGDGGQEGKRRYARELEEQRGSTVATVGGRKKGEEEEDEFGVFMQADGQPAWGEGVTVSVSAPCGSRGNFAGESTHWTPGWTDSAFHQSDDSWTAFPQDASDEGRDLVGQWWPTSAAEERRDRPSANQNLATVFAEAFPSPPGSSPSDPHDLDTVPTLTQLLRRRASQHQGRLLDSYHDLNKMIGQRYKRANGVSRDLLLTTLHLEPPHTESRPAPRTASRRLSPGLPSANQHAQNAVAKRRLSYDHNRNVME